MPRPVGRTVLAESNAVLPHPLDQSQVAGIEQAPAGGGRIERRMRQLRHDRHQVLDSPAAITS